MGPVGAPARLLTRLDAPEISVRQAGVRGSVDVPSDEVPRPTGRCFPARRVTRRQPVEPLTSRQPSATPSSSRPPAAAGSRPSLGPVDARVASSTSLPPGSGTGGSTRGVEGGGGGGGPRVTEHPPEPPPRSSVPPSSRALPSSLRPAGRRGEDRGAGHGHRLHALRQCCRSRDRRRCHGRGGHARPVSARHGREGRRCHRRRGRLWAASGRRPGRAGAGSAATLRRRQSASAITRRPVGGTRRRIRRLGWRRERWPCFPEHRDPSRARGAPARHRAEDQAAAREEAPSERSRSCGSAASSVRRPSRTSGHSSRRASGCRVPPAGRRGHGGQPRTRTCI